MAPATHRSVPGIDEIVCQSIHAKRLVSLVYRGGERIVEPYMLFATKAGELVLHGWQVDGAWETTPPPHWANLRLADISSLVPLDVFTAMYPSE